MIDPQPVDEALGDQRAATSSWVRSNTSGSSWRTPARSVDVEEAAVAPGDRVDVEELVAQLRVGPVAVGIVDRHVVGDDVEHDAQPGLVGRVGQRPELLLAAEVVGEPRRVDHVVAVLGARPRLHRRRQVQVRDPEVAQVGHQLPRRRRTRTRGVELEAVGRPQLAGVTSDPLEHDDRAATSPRPRSAPGSARCPARLGSAVDSSSTQLAPKRRRRAA